MEKERLFQFKQFAVRHARSALPVGFDGVLLGAWVDVAGANRVLDVGTGCGLIALMCTQRNPSCTVDAIDIHAPSVEEAALNFTNSPWSDRLNVKIADFCCMATDTHKYDLIISNPPFFEAGLTDVANNARLQARHNVLFGPEALITCGAKMISDKGSIALVAPYSMAQKLESTTLDNGMHIKRMCIVAGTSRKPPKRILLQICKFACECSTERLTVHTDDGNFSAAYRQLTQQFYLKF